MSLAWEGMIATLIVIAVAIWWSFYAIIKDKKAEEPMGDNQNGK